MKIIKTHNMTNYFEVTKRDGPARIGKIMLKEEIITPHIIKNESLSEKGPILFMGSFLKYKSKEEILNFIKKNKNSKNLLILPYTPYLAGKEREIIGDLPDQVPKGIVINAVLGEEKTNPSDLYVISCSNQLKTAPRTLISSIVKIRDKIPPDAALYLPAFATPKNLSILVYLGIDVFDDTFAEISGYQDIYLTNDRDFFLNKLSELPCLCEVCQSMSIGQLKKLPKNKRSLLLAKHNKLKLTEELIKTREFIKNGVIREYVEKQCRSSPFLTASLRFFDFEPNFIEKRTPVARKNTLYANSMESLNRVEVRRFFDRVQKRYYPPRSNVLILLPCSAKKPYSISQSHQKFIRALSGLRGKIHEVIISSPLGVVPRELETVYPASHYDVPVTGYWDREEQDWVFCCLKNYLEKNRYDYIIAHLEGAYKKICQEASDDLGLDVEYTSFERVTSFESLDMLRGAVKKACEGKNHQFKANYEQKEDMIKSIADYQFGLGAGDLLLKDREMNMNKISIKIKGKFPNYHVYRKSQHFLVLNEYGLINLSIEAAKALLSLNTYQVKIGDFEIKGSVLAPGVIDTDPQIRENDEVMVLGKKAFGVGRAKMNGWEMVESERGVAVDMRHVENFPR